MTRHRAFPELKRVALAGFGVVGQGVYARLAAASERFDVVGAFCRNPARHQANGLPPRLLTDRFDALAPFDILVEAIGGVSPAEDIALAALRRGADVVSANKTLLSRRFETLHAAAAQSGARLLYSAAVGGGVPMLEAVDEAAARGRLDRIDAVVNGTTNFVLDRIGAGFDLDDAVRLAQEAGYAEADPSADIDGVDAAEKISLLARRAFGAAIDPDDVASDRLASIPISAIAGAQRRGAPFKQIASAWHERDGVRCAVRLAQVSGDNPLAKPRLEENCLVITPESGERVILHGKGAGREPTADSVLADLLRLAPVRAT
ncbi:MAG: homoserine dehydrogenase [Parvularculaceae bacterium]